MAEVSSGGPAKQSSWAVKKRIESYMVHAPGCKCHGLDEARKERDLVDSKVYALQGPKFFSRKKRRPGRIVAHLPAELHTLDNEREFLAQHVKPRGLVKPVRIRECGLEGGPSHKNGAGLVLGSEAGLKEVSTRFDALRRSKRKKRKRKPASDDLASQLVAVPLCLLRVASRDPVAFLEALHERLEVKTGKKQGPPQMQFVLREVASSRAFWTRVEEHEWDEQDTCLLLCLVDDWDDHWAVQLPGGKREMGESAEECAVREASEESAGVLDLPLPPLAQLSTSSSSPSPGVCVDDAMKDAGKANGARGGGEQEGGCGGARSDGVTGSSSSRFELLGWYVETATMTAFGYWYNSSNSSGHDEHASSAPPDVMTRPLRPAQNQRQSVGGRQLRTRKEGDGVLVPPHTHRRLDGSGKHGPSAVEAFACGAKVARALKQPVGACVLSAEPVVVQRGNGCVDGGGVSGKKRKKRSRGGKACGGHDVGGGGGGSGGGEGADGAAAAAAAAADGGKDDHGGISGDTAGVDRGGDDGGGGADAGGQHEAACGEKRKKRKRKRKEKGANNSHG